MKTILLLILGMSSLALAQKPNCVKCQAMAKVETKLLALDYAKESDSTAGYDNFNVAMDYMDKFKAEKQHNPAEFAALVKLSGAALLYDTESYLARSISFLIGSSVELKSVYDKTLPQIEPCRRQQLTILVNEGLCDANLVKKGLWEKPGHEAAEDACVDKSRFSVESCLKSKNKPETTK